MTLRNARVHPALPDARAAQGLAPHPPLRTVRQRQPCRQHRAGARVARRAVPSKEPETPEATAVDEPRVLPRPCPCCGGRMIIIETFARGCEPKHRPTPAASDQDRHLMTLSPPIDRPQLTLAILAGSRPAAPARIAPLDSAASRIANLVGQRALRSFTPARSPMLRGKPIVADRFGPTSSSPTPRPNPHSARGTAGAPLPAISCLGAFRTPAATARG